MTKEICQIELTSLSHDGRAVGRQTLEGGARVVFVEGALPGQVVRAAITKSKKSFAEAVCLEVVQQAPESIQAPCPHAASTPEGHSCGGCALQSMPSDTQLYWKERMVQEAMTRIAKLSPEELTRLQAIIPSPKAWGYRNKMEFAFGENSDGSLVLGLRAKASHTVLAVPHCRLLPEGCMDIVRQVQSWCTEAKLKAWTGQRNHANPYAILRHLIIRRPHTAQENGSAQLLVNLITAPASKEQRLSLARLGKELMQHCRTVTGFVLEERRSAAMIAQGEHIITKLGETTLFETLGHMPYALAHNAFFQINTEAAEAMCALVNDMACDTPLPEAPCLWDLYCGVGAPGLSLVKQLVQQGYKDVSVYGVEINPKAIEMAKSNAKTLGLTQVHYHAGDTKKIIRDWPQPTLIVIDPPRTGLDGQVTELVAKSGAEKIIYISCNPATLARDMGLLSQQYSLKTLVPLDFFPQTPHVESVALLVKKEA